MTMRDRLAQAIAQAQDAGNVVLVPGAQDYDAADAALAAMREPSEAMETAMRRESGKPPMVGQSRAVTVWQAGIDAARNEEASDG